jgi:hypothetical protein
MRDIEADAATEITAERLAHAHHHPIFEKVEIPIPRILLRLCALSYDWIFSVFRVLGGDTEVMELRTMLLFWEIFCFLWKGIYGFLANALDQILQNPAHRHHGVYYKLDLIRAHITNGAGAGAGSVASSQGQQRPQILLPMLNVLESQQQQMDGLIPSWDTHDLLAVFILEMVWILFFPYILKLTIIPILRRLLTVRRTE